MSIFIAPAGPGGGERFLTFTLGVENYGIPFGCVDTVRPLGAAMPLLQAPAYESGVVVINDQTIPVLDLRVSFGRVARFDAETRLVVVRLRGSPPAADRLGLLVDRVGDARVFEAADIEPPPDFGPDIVTDYILGVVPGPGGVRILLDVDHLFDAGGTPAATPAG